jgi:membrane protein DedA with SNARE-associated domain
LEELISPIPATLVLGLAGSLIALKGTGLLYLGFLTLLGTAGKTFAAYLTYWLGRLLGRYVLTHFGHLFGVKESDITDTNRRFKKGHSWSLIFALRALPLAPSAAVSLSAGILHLGQRSFVSATFVGYIFRNALTAWFGYVGLDLFANWQKYLENPLYLVLIVLTLLGLALYLAVKTFRHVNR